jgi:hypothetical protein
MCPAGSEQEEMNWTLSLTPGVSVSGLSLGMHVDAVRTLLAHLPSVTIPFDRNSKEFNWLRYREAGIQLMFDGSWSLVQIMCLQESGLSLGDGTSLFELRQGDMNKALRALGYKLVPKTEGFFETSPEIFGGRFYKRELIVFTVSIEDLTN